MPQVVVLIEGTPVFDATGPGGVEVQVRQSADGLMTEAHVNMESNSHAVTSLQRGTDEVSTAEREAV